jgi:hypothetical protein
MASVAVDWRDMSGSFSSSPPRATEVSSSRQPQTAAREKNVGSSSRSAAHPAREDQWEVRSRVGRRGVESPTSSSQPSEAVGGATGSSPPTFRRLQPPRLGLPADAPVAGEVDRLGVDAERATGGGFQRRPAAPSVIAYPGRPAPDLHISLVTGRGQGSTPVVVGSEDQPPSSWGSTAPPLRR